MPRTTDDTFKNEKNKQENQPIWLYTIEDYDGASNDLHFAEYGTDIVYDGITYLKFPIKHEFVGENTSGTVDAVSIKISNVSRAIQAYLELYDWRGKKVIIKKVWANELADTTAYADDIYYIDNYTSNQELAEFVLTSKFDVLDAELPLRNYTRNHCNWKFKSTECGYVGGETVCNKTKQRCKELVNYDRIGAFPSVPGKKIYTGA